MTSKTDIGTAGLRDILKKLSGPPETIDGADVEQVARECVALDVAFSPVLPHRFQEGKIPTPERVEHWGNDGYVMKDDRAGHFRRVPEEEVKVMRARFLLLKGVLYRRLRQMPYLEQQRVIGQYFDGSVWLPPEGGELAKSMGVL